MEIGVIIARNDAETCWNALRFANFALGQKDTMKVFFMGKGVEYQKVSTAKFNTVAQADEFIKSGGKVYACGTCLTSSSIFRFRSYRESHEQHRCAAGEERQEIPESERLEARGRRQ